MNFLRNLFASIFGTLIANRKMRKFHFEDNETKSLINLLSAIDAGIIGICVCLMFVNFVECVFLFVQIIICAIIRDLISQRITNV